MDPALPEVLNVRGALQFRRGNIDASIEDFTHAIQLKPEDGPHHWQRGISYYYAERYTRIFNLMFYIPTFQRPSASLFIGARTR